MYVLCQVGQSVWWVGRRSADKKKVKTAPLSGDSIQYKLRPDVVLCCKPSRTAKDAQPSPRWSRQRPRKNLIYGVRARLGLHRP
jgi:hypothetical protein